LHRAADLPVYFYQYTHPLPPKRGAPPNSLRAIGAAYDAQVAYALGNLDNEPSYAWTPDDREVSRIFSGYIERFVKTGDPYNPYLPPWPVVRGGEDLTRQTIGTPTRMEIAREAARIALVESYQNFVSTDFDFKLPRVTE
jgi:para-nitrobenzyl esterase